MMKSIFTFLLTVFVLAISQLNLFAQNSDFTQYYSNLPMANPGFTGIDPYLSLKSGYKNRWSSFSDNNEQFFISGYTPINKLTQNVLKNKTLRVSNPNASDVIYENKKIRRINGIGVALTAEKFGPLNSTSISINYAYHLPISENSNLAFGTNIKVNQNKIDFTDYTVRNPDDDIFIQQLLNAQEGKQTDFKLDFGAVFYSEKYYLGFSSEDLVSEEIGNGVINDFLVMSEFNFISGVFFKLNPLLQLSPSTRVLWNDIYGVNWEAAMRLRYKNVVDVGFAYKNDVKASFMLGLTINDNFNINYSYDHIISDLNNFGSGNHELVLGIALFNKYSLSRKYW